MNGSHEAAAGSGRAVALLEPLREEGRRLDAGVRADLERSLGASFGDVVVHTGSASGAAADRADAAAFTVGRHVVFGQGSYEPESARGRMLLAHELAHVVQQRRGGGDPDLGERFPTSSLTRDSGQHSEHSAGATAAQAALGMSAPVGGAAPVGVARKDKEEEKSWRDVLWEQAKEKIRDKAMETLGTVEGVALEAGQIVDTVVWAESEGVDAVDNAIDYWGKKAGVAQKTLETVKSFNAGDFKAARAQAQKLGMVDPDTGAPIVSGKITEQFDRAEKGLNETVFAGVKKDEGLFTTRELGQLEGAIGSQVALSFVGIEEVQLALKVVSGVGVFKAIVDAMQKNPAGFATDRHFWLAVANAVLHVAGLKAASAGKKVITLIVDIIRFSLDSGSEIAQLREDYLKPPSPERDKALKKDVQALIKVVASAIQQALTHHKDLRKARAGGPGEPGEQGTPGVRKGETDILAPPGSKTLTAGAGGEATTPGAVVEVQPAAKSARQGPSATSDVPSPGAKTKLVEAASVIDPEAAPQQGAASTAKQKPTAKPTSPAKQKPTAKPVTAEGPGETAAAPSLAAAAKPKSLSKTTEAAAAGRRMEKVAQARKDLAESAVADAHSGLESAKKRLAAAKEATAAEPAAAVGKTQKFSPAEKERRAAERGVASAEKKLAQAQADAKDASARAAAAMTEAAKRAAALQAAVEAAAAKKEAAAAKSAGPSKESGPGTPEGSDPKATKAVDAAVLKAVRKQAKELHKQAVTDPTAVDKLRDLYEGQPDAALRKLKGDPVAAAELQRRRAMNPELAEVLASESRMPHEATVRVQDQSGKTLPPEKLTSGGVTAEDIKKFGWREATQASHTEAKAVAKYPLKPGQTMRIDGQYDPCASCRTRMQAAATAGGGTIVYWWPGGPPGGMRFTPGGDQ